MSSSLLSGLNPQQLEAVRHGAGPLLILAGAGSGKTRVITHRIAHLIQEEGACSGSILAMTFTNKAAQEMQERVAHLLGQGAGAPWISTFHSFCVRVLRREYDFVGGKRDFVIYADDEQLALVKTICKQLGLEDKQFTPRSVLSRISNAKNKGWDPKRLLEQSADPRTERVAVVYERYQRELRKANALDFDDLLLETERLFRESNEVRERYNEQLAYVMVDEYQDTNRPQYELMRLLTRQRQNIAVVGDEDQSIYSWRGADIRNILDFERDFPDAKVIRLEQNYRSTKNILEAASAVVANNIERKGKTLWTEAAAGAKIGLYEAPDGENEALFVADSIRRIVREQAKTHIAILYRTNSQSRLFEEALRRYGQPYRVVGGFSFYERAEIKDLLAYLKVALNPDDSMSLLRIINTPTRGIGKTTIDLLERTALEQNLSIIGAIDRLTGDPQQELAQRTRTALREFRSLVHDMVELREAGGDTSDLLKLVVDRTGYVRHLKAEDTPEAQTRVENIEELFNAAADAGDRSETIAGFLDHAALVSDQDEYDAAAAVTLMTLHSAKGLEFPYVFLVGMEDGLFPHSRAVNSNREMEEERRLCYVGMTRARQQLTLSYARFRRRFGAGAPEPTISSRFLSEVPAALLEDLSPAGSSQTIARQTIAHESGPVYVREGYNQETGAGRRSSYNEVNNINSFFRKESAPKPASTRPAAPAKPAAPFTVGKTPLPVSARGLKPGARVRHARYGTGTVLRIEGEGDETKLTVTFPGFGLKKMLEKMAGLERL